MTRGIIQSVPTCPECHAEVSDTEWAETGRCSVCGYSFPEHSALPESNPEIQTAAEPTPPKGPTVASNKIIVGGILGLIVVVFVVASPYLFSPQPSIHNFKISVTSDTCWSGSLGGSRGQTTYDGCNNSSWNGMDTHTAAVFQKTTDTGYLTLTIAEDGNSCYTSTTTAAYGLVSGTC